MDQLITPHVRTLMMRLACAVALGIVIAWRPLSRRPMKTEVKHALLIMTVASSMLMFIIGESTARAFGVVGLGSFIRFRSSIKDPRDVVQFFLSIGTGMACGHGDIPIATVGVATVWALLVVLDWSWKPSAAEAPEGKPAPNPAWDDNDEEFRDEHRSVKIHG